MAKAVRKKRVAPKQKRGSIALTYALPMDEDYTKKSIGEVIVDILNSSYCGLIDFKVRRGSVDID